MIRPDLNRLYSPGESIPTGLGEIVPMVNKSDAIQGYVLKETAHRFNLPDRIAAVMLTTPDGKDLFFQQRSASKKLFPNALTLAATGHVDYRDGECETYEKAAIREFEEELGQPCPPLQSIGKFLIDAGHHGMYNVFKGAHYGEASDFRPDPSEVSGVILVSRKKLPQLADQFTPPARKILERMGYLHR